MRRLALVLLVGFGLSALLPGCPFFTRRDRGGEPAAAGAAD